MTIAAAEDRDRVGPYRVIRAIGAGGTSRVDIARIDRAYGFQRHVVIKRPLEHLRSNAQVAASLRREARIGSRLRHPNLVAILDAGVHDGYDYLVLEYVHGSALRTLMQCDAPGQVRELPLAVALAIVCDVARGMHEAHELTDDHRSPLGLVHRDVSPGNILLGFDGSVKLADFGIAKETRVSTLSGSIHGTVTYMAPEQCQGHAFDRRADVFSLGVILYELVTGTRLFWADNDVASLHRVLSGSVPRPRKIKPQLSSALEDIILTAVAHDADRRYSTALELATALERHAASAGEVLGARWIARTVEDLVGVKQAPWIASAATPEAAQRGDGSLVELIAAAGPDEPVEPSFGDPDDAAGEEPVEPAGNAAVATGRSPRRARRLAAVVLAVVGASAVVVWTRSSQPPAPPAPATSLAPPALAVPPATPPVTSAGPAANTEPAVRAEPAPIAAPTESTPMASPATGAAPTSTTAVAGKRRRRPAPARTAPAPTPSATASAPSPATPATTTPSAAAEPRRDVETPASPPGSTPREAGSGPARPAVNTAPVNVQWKPTLLLPTDGSAASPPK